MKSMRFKTTTLTQTIFVCLLSFGVTQIVYANHSLLSPPWYLLQAKLSATLNSDPCVHVSDIIGEDLDMNIKIEVCNYDKAVALSAFLNKKHEFGKGAAVTTQVYAPGQLPVVTNLPKGAEETSEFLNRALSGNTYFVKTGIVKNTAYAEFKPAVVQYHSDDLSDVYLNTNLVASTAFREVLDLNLFSDKTARAYATTSKMTS